MVVMGRGRNSSALLLVNKFILLRNYQNFDPAKAAQLDRIIKLDLLTDSSKLKPNIIGDTSLQCLLSK
jgi:hypothetical protein